MSQREDGAILRAVFDALPSLVFVVDEDVRIQEYNSAAAELLKDDRGTILKHRAGDLLHCVHAGESERGCGTAPFCADCIIRNSVNEAFEGKRIVRRRTRMELVSGHKTAELYALVTASSFSYEGRSLVLLVIEDISELAELYRMIPICSVCGKVRDDRESWMRMESYFKETWDVDFSHGLCPDCLKAEMEKVGSS
jgi:PAS domain-containing protein